MLDRETIIRGLRDMCDFIVDRKGIMQSRAYIHATDDAIAMLKEQEPAKQNDGSCPNCGWNFENGDLDFSKLDSQKFFCPNCGQAVKWND